MSLLIGADPELFVSEGDKFVSGYNMIPGTKKAPHPVKNGAVQVDGMALEFNIDPASTKTEFIRNINSVQRQLREMIPYKYRLKTVPTAHFEPELMASQPLEATELGCDPDFNAYTGLPNPRPNGDVPFRTGSGHIHVGWTEGMDINDPDHLEACRMMTKQMDVILGLLSPLWDKDTQRRTLYGNLGAFRPKPYGVEYRVLSNAWLRNDKLKRMVFELTSFAYNELINGRPFYQLNDPIDTLHFRDIGSLKSLFENNIFNYEYYQKARRLVNRYEGFLSYDSFTTLNSLIDKCLGNLPKKANKGLSKAVFIVNPTWGYTL